MDIKNDALYNSWLSTMKKNTKKSYAYGLLEYCRFLDKTPVQLIDEARRDYLDRVPPWEVRPVIDLERYTEFLKSESSANMTKLTRINAIKNFYKFNKIPLLVNASNIANITTEKYLDIPVMKIEDIRKFVNTCGSKLKLKALILTFISSGQAQGEILKLKGKHLKNIVSGVAIVNLTRGKTNQRYTFFISGEALEAIKEYKKDIPDEEYIFTLDKNKDPLVIEIVDNMFARHARGLGYDRAYFSPHRARHFFKTSLTGIVDSTFVEYWLGHKPRGTDANYFIGSSIQDRMLEAYIKNLDMLTVFTDKEVLQKQYDELKGKVDVEKEELKTRIDAMEEQRKQDVAKQEEWIKALIEKGVAEKMEKK
ncbi:MAG: site-specific integrase [Candidatus Methanoperedens sp.]